MPHLFSRLMMMLRSRGHGVHSPFAYSFITEVIGERSCRYYAYDWIEAAAADRREARMAELIYRVGNRFFDPAGERSARLYGGTPLMQQALAAACPASSCAVDIFLDTRNPQWASACESAMAFTDGRIGIAVHNPDLPVQLYKVIML